MATTVTRRLCEVALGAALALGGCRNDPASAVAPSASTGVETAPASGSRVRALQAIEHRRASSDFREDDFSHRNVEVRRLAARAAARIADGRSAELLGRALADEDPEVVGWAAYGLGFACEGRAPETVRRLVSRAASVWSSDAGTSSAPVDPATAICNALARCGTRDAERTLRGWLAGDRHRAEAAAIGLGRIASAQKRLEDASLVALLDAASADVPLDNALFAFTRLPKLAPSVEQRLLDVATQALTSDGRQRVFAIRSLASAGESAAEPLLGVLTDPKAAAAERADAAHALGRLGEAGASVLAEALVGWIEDPKTLKLASPSWGPLWIAAGKADPKPAEAKTAFEKLAELAVPEAKGTERRRTIELRCRAAARLAGTASRSARLVACDPDEGRARALATLDVLGNGRLRGGRFRAWKAFAESEDRVVRQKALSLMPAHPEIAEPSKLIAGALASPHAGVVATAASVLAAYPDRASSDHDLADRRGEGDVAKHPKDLALDPDDEVVAALTAAFEAERPADDLEVRVELMQAAAALQLLSLKPKIEPWCKSSNPTLRKNAERALQVLGDKLARCDQFDPDVAPPDELRRVPTKRVRLMLDTDAGALTLELHPEVAPVAATRVVDLARAGFYDGVSVHRVVPGFVAQFGDPGGDGYGGADKPPLRCETSPFEFDALRVGVALAGRDTGSSQLFVTLGPFPHLTGDYAWIGTATGNWNAVAPGDRIRKVRVE